MEFKSHNFQVGDKIVVKMPSNFTQDHSIDFGQTGTVVHFLGENIGVRMDNYNYRLHSLSGRCEFGHGYYFKPHEIGEPLGDSEFKTKEEYANEPLENWEHPYHGKKILVRFSEDSDWQERTFLYYNKGRDFPVIVENERGMTSSHRYYKFPDEVPAMTKEEAQAKFNIRIVD